MDKKEEHKFELDISSLKRIEELLPKLKYAVNPSDLIKWIENFEIADLSIAYDFLYAFEYIPYKELQNRLEEQFILLSEKICEDDRILIIPYGKLGKSGSFMTYPLAHSTYFKELENEIKFCNDPTDFEPNDFNCIIFLDDFIGTGETFEKFYHDPSFNSWLKKVKCSNPNFKEFILATIVMSDAKINLNFDHGINIQIFAQERNKAFDEKKSLFLAFSEVLDYSNFNTKYEKFFKLGKDFKNGYRSSESLVAFDHNTPDNTLPIFWNDEDWFPIFPRNSKTSMNRVKEFKKSIAFFIGMCNRLGKDLFNFSSSTYKKNGKTFRRISHNKKIDFSVLALLFLKRKNQNDIIISHLLGLTMPELDDVYLEAKSKQYISSQNELTVIGKKYLEKLIFETRKENFFRKNEHKKNLYENIYVPESFRGL